MLLQATRPIPGQNTDSSSNMIFKDENDILPKSIPAGIVLTRSLTRAKRQIQFKEREKLNENLYRIRQHRQTGQFRGKFHGQTQTQYLNAGNDEQKEGKAEAEATQQSSRAVVSKHSII